MNGISRSAIAALCCTIAAGAAQAQPAAAGSSTGPGAASSDQGDIIVTARRAEERLQDVPISITVFNQQQLAERNIVTPSDLATYTPSLSISSQFGPEKSAFIIRGFTQEIGTAPSVGTYFADVVSPRIPSGTVSGNAAGNLFDLQSVQVLKGPQGTLFGRNTTGGAVLLVPQKPTGKLEGYVEGSAGDYGMLREQAVINVPVADTIRVRLGVDHNTRDGYMRNAATGQDFNDLNYLALRASLVVDVTPNLENYTILSYSRSSTNGFGTRVVGCDTNPTAFLAQVIAPLACAQVARSNARGDDLTQVDAYSPGAFLKIRTWQAINTTTWRAGDALTIKNIASYAQYREREQYSLFGDNFLTPLSPTLGPIPFIELGNNPGTNIADQSSFTDELQFSGHALGNRLTWQAGAYIELSRPLGYSESAVPVLLRCANVAALQCSPIAEFGFLGPLLGSINQAATKTRFNNKGFYAQGTYKLSDQFAVTGGIRYTIDRTTSLSETTVVNFPAPNTPIVTCLNKLVFPSTPVTDRSQCRNTIGVKSEAPTWLIDLEYKPVSDVLLFAKYTRGYRQGGVNTGNIGLETWQPEKVDSYEIGAKTSFHGAVSGYFNAVGFYNDFRNQQIQGNLVNKPGTPQTGGTAIVNAGKSRIWGIEIDSAVTLFRGFQLQAGYTYLNTKLLELTKPTLSATSPFSDVTLTADVGKPLAYAPRNRATLTGTYTLPLDAGIGRVSAGVTYIYTASQNTIAPSASPIFYRLPATNLVNLNLDWKGVLGLPVDASLFVTNLTNRLYPTAAGGAWSFAGFANYNIAPPRMFGARLRYRFGG